MIMDAVNTIVNTLITVPGYGAVIKIPKTGLGTMHTPDSLTHIYCYVENVIT